MAINEKIVLEAEDRASAALRKAGGSVEDLEGHTERAGKAADRADRSFGKWGKGLKGALFAGGATIAIAKIGQLAGAAVQAAVNAGEAASAFETTFGEAVGGASTFVEDFATKAGFATHELQQMLAITGNVVQGIGATETESAELAETMATLAGDVASFSNAQGGAEAVMLALQSAINGEREALKTYGLAVSETEVQQAALNATGKESADDLTRLEKAYATVEIATQKAGKAIGDLDRTQDSAANRQRALRAELKDFQVELGQRFLPVWESVLETAINLAPELERIVVGMDNAASAFADAAESGNPIVTTLLDVHRGFAAVGDVATGAGRAALGQFKAITGVLTFNPGRATAGWKEVGGAIKGVFDNLQVRTGEQSLIQHLREGVDPTLALANSLAFLDRQGELTGETIRRFASITGIADEELLALLFEMRARRDEWGLSETGARGLAGTMSELGHASGSSAGEVDTTSDAISNLGDMSAGADRVLMGYRDTVDDVGRKQSAAAGTADAWASRVDTLATNLLIAAEAGENVHEVLNKTTDPVFAAVDAWQDYADTVKAANEDGTVTAQEELDILRGKLDLNAALSDAGANWDEAMQAIALATGTPIGEVEALLEKLEMIDGRTFTGAVDIIHETHYTETGTKPTPTQGDGDPGLPVFAAGTWSVPGNRNDEIPATLHGSEIVIPPEGSGGRADFARQLAAEMSRAMGNGGGRPIGPIIVYANDRAGGEAAADAIEDRLHELAIQGDT